MKFLNLNGKLLVAAAFLGVFLAQGQAAWKITQEQKVNHLGVIIHSGSTNIVGSAFVLGEHKEIVTCAHVVLGATNYSYVSVNQVKRPLRLKYVLPKYDLAVLTTDVSIPGEPFKVGDFKRIRPGDRVFYVGFDQRIRGVQINTAIVSAVGAALNDGITVDFLEFEGVGIPGYSGGAVLNENGELIAVMREAWVKRGVKGGEAGLINRAFSMEMLSVLDGQVYLGVTSSPTGEKLKQKGK